MLKIQTTISGYGDKPISLFSAYDEDSRVLVISVEHDFMSQRKGDCVVITNDLEIPRDRFFSEKDLRDAIHAYHELQNGLASDGKSTRLIFGDRASRVDPENAIQSDGMDESGAKFRVREGITNGQIATLATCLYAYESSAIEDVVSMQEDILSLLNGHEILMTI